MATISKQRHDIDSARERAKAYFVTELATWTRNVIATWIPFTTVIPQEAETELQVIMSRGYDRTVNQVLGTDWRLYRQQQDEYDPYEEAMTAIAAALLVLLPDRSNASISAILSTLRNQMSRASTLAADVEEATTQAARDRTARKLLSSRMKEHRLIIGTTEANWLVNTTRRTAIISVTDPLGNSVEQIAALIQAGDINAAKRLANKVNKLARLPTSVTQGELIRTVYDVRDRLVTPLAQARAIATMRERRDRLGKQEKRWEAIFRNTRPSHAAAHMQVKPIDEPFEVGGALLQWPMDGSLGAPLGEIVNCQCRSVYL